MDPILLQKQLRDNSNDLQDYFKDIQSWGEEMKRKETSTNSSEVSDVPLPRNKVPKISKKENKTNTDTSKSEVKSKVPKDFTFWEKLDVEAECEKLDQPKSDEDSDLTDEYDDDTIEMANEEKEKGNKFVKVGRWKDAVKCYTQAIACFNYDATFYANRALCHLKLEQYKSAEADCTIAIQLDPNYIKALHRRAVARDALKQYKEAKEDLEKVLVTEPENKESQKLLDKIDKLLKPTKQTTKVEPTVQRPVSKFTASRQSKPVASTSSTCEVEEVGPALKELVVERKKPEIKKSVPEPKIAKIQETTPPKSRVTSSYNTLWPSGEGINVEIVKSFTKPPKDRSRISLRRIEVQETSLKITAKP